jgi:hypothetical protein
MQNVGRGKTERLIETGQFVDTSEANKTTLKQMLLERYEREVSSKEKKPLVTKESLYFSNCCSSNNRFNDIFKILLIFNYGKTYKDIFLYLLVKVESINRSKLC